MNEYERVKKEALLTDLEMFSCVIGCDCVEGCKKCHTNIAQAQLEKVLNNDGILIKADDQSLPYYPNTIFDSNSIRAYKEGQQDMLIKDFKKVEPLKEEQ